MVDLDYMSLQELGKAGMPVAGMYCPGTSFVGRIVDCPDIEGIVVAVVGQGWVGTAGIVDSGSQMADHSMTLD
jgi:hypothetical protein